MKKNKKVVDFDEIEVRPETVAIGIGIILLAALAVAVFLAYETNTSAGIRIKGFFSKTVPVPAAIMEYRHFVLASDLGKNLASLQQFYATQDFAQTGLRVDFSTPEGQKRLEIKKRELLQKMVEDKAIELLASRKGIHISQDQIDQIVNQKLQEFGTAEDIKKNLLDSYGWTIADFKKQVVLPGAYKDALIAYFDEKESNSAKTREIVDKAKSELEGGKSFEQVVDLYSVGSSKKNGGQLGWVKKAQLLPELQTALFDKGNFKNDSIIESSIGFHIVEIENQKKDENGESVIQLRQIFVAKYSFADWLSDQMKKMSIILPFNEFVWNKNQGSVDFRDSNLAKFEEKSRAEAEGDASLVF